LGHLTALILLSTGLNGQDRRRGLNVHRITAIVRTYVPVAVETIKVAELLRPATPTVGLYIDSVVKEC
jgi:hypothetical protein